MFKKWCNRKISNAEYLKLGESCLKSMESVYKDMYRTNSKPAENMNISRADEIRNFIEDTEKRMANPFIGKDPQSE
ncbi:hypothetical protein GV64_17555 [Endozoicomonas elysicola]|uniref:Uncharacterized protein n=1 Tax=Endozoicomonas elysicola TaxID=305900 RepID=A0A081KDR5_9GAMM|nr:hypothetical protein GV64_17555 [Endozoicomonas elysicola]